MVESSKYRCEACGATLTSEGTGALDHMVSEHGVDPETGPPHMFGGTVNQANGQSNPALKSTGVTGALPATFTPTAAMNRGCGVWMTRSA